jgi:hypothetical protein
MTTFDIEEKPGKWFKMPGGGRVQLRTLTSNDWKAIRKVSVKHEPFVHEIDLELPNKEIKKIPTVLDHEIIDQALQSEMVNDLSIVDWEGLFDKNKKPIPCNYDTKTLLMSLKDPSFRDFVNTKMKVLQEAEAKEAKENEKNLSTSQSGEPA